VEEEIEKSTEKDEGRKTPVDVSATPSTGSTVERPAHRKRAAKPKKARVEKAGIEGIPEKTKKKDQTKNKRQKISERTKERMDGDLESKSSEESTPIPGPTSEENPQKLIKKSDSTPELPVSAMTEVQPKAKSTPSSEKARERRKRKRRPVEEVEEAEEVDQPVDRQIEEIPIKEMEREEELAQKPEIVRRSEEVYAAAVQSPRQVAEISEPDVVEVEEPEKRDISDKEGSDEKARSDERSSYSSSISEERRSGAPVEQDEGMLAEKTEVTKADLHPDEEDDIIRPVSDENPIVLQEQERRRKAILGVDKAIPYKSDKSNVRGASGTNVPHE